MWGIDPQRLSLSIYSFEGGIVRVNPTIDFMTGEITPPPASQSGGANKFEPLRSLPMRSSSKVRFDSDASIARNAKLLDRQRFFLNPTQYDLPPFDTGMIWAAIRL
jgi:hypothetical protein